MFSISWWGAEWIQEGEVQQLRSLAHFHHPTPVLHKTCSSGKDNGCSTVQRRPCLPVVSCHSRGCASDDTMWRQAIFLSWRSGSYHKGEGAVCLVCVGQQNKIIRSKAGWKLHSFKWLSAPAFCSWNIFVLYQACWILFTSGIFAHCLPINPQGQAVLWHLHLL